jgi:hypothetical protein
MATIVTRSGKGSPLTNNEVDANFTNLNTELGTKANTSSLATVATTGAYADLTGKPTIASADGSVVVTGTTNIDLSVGVAGSTSNVVLPIRNTTGATLAKGTAVYISGATGQLSTVSKAVASSDPTSAQTLGLVTDNIANNSNGNVTLIGTITNIDTSAYTDGQQLYLSPTTAGTLTATKPYAPQHLVYVAVVEHAHPSQGKLFVKVQNGYEMDELHDVSAQNPANNDGLFYNTSTSLWEKKSIATALGFTPYNATNPAGYITGITSGNVTTALGYTPANRAGDTFTGPITVNSGANQAILGSDGAIELTRGAGGAYIDFKDSTAEDFDVRLQASGSQLNISAAGGLTLNGAGVLTGITSGQVTTALGYTPYNATNPAGYITSAGSISGNAATATNISNTGTVTLASATESNSIYATAPSYTADQPTKLLNFDWYGNVFSLGNIRSGSTPSSGFGVYYTPSGGSRAELMRVDTSGNVLINRTSASGIGKLNVEGGVDVTSANVTVQAGYGIAWRGDQSRIMTPDDNSYGALIRWGATGGCRLFESTTERLRIDGTGSVTAFVDFRAPVFYDTNNTAFYANMAGTSEFNTIQTRGGDGFRSFATPSASIKSQIYFADAGNTRAWNWQLDENNNAALWSYGGSSWGKRLGVTHNSEMFLRNSSGTDISVAYPSTFGYSSAYRTMILGNQAYTTVCIGVDPVANASGSFNGAGSGVEVMFKNGVNFITPNSANNSYLNVMQMTDGVANFTAYATAAGSFRAPIFYDTDNTAYYVDPASGSNLIGQVQINGGTTMSGGWNRALYLASNFPVIVMNSYNAKYSGIGVDYSEAQSGMVFWVNGNSADITNGSATAALRINTGNYVVANDFRAAIFYDSNDTAYYINPNSSGTSAVFAGDIHINDTTWGADKALRFREGASDTYGGFIKYTAGDSLELGTRNNSTTDTRAIYISRGANWAGSDGSFRAPIFYDSENTAYYVDPNSTSRTNYIWSSVGTYGANSTGTFGGNTSGLTGVSQVLEVRANGAIPLMTWHYENVATRHIGLDANGFLQVYNPSEAGGSVFQANTSIRAPIFYDTTDTAYYWNFASGAQSNIYTFITGLAYYQSQFGSGVYSGAVANAPLQVYSNDGGTAMMSFHRAGAYAINMGLDPDNHLRIGGWSAAANRWVLDGSGNNWVAGSFRAPVFYDSDDTGYYLDAASTSRINQINYTALYSASNTDYGIVGNNGFFDTVNSGVDADALELCYVRGSEVRIGTSGGNKAIRASLFYKGTNTAYFVNPDGTSILNTVSVAQNNGVNFNGAGSTYIIGTSGDGANSTTANLKIQSWFGIGFGPTISGQLVPNGENAVWIDCRNGDLTARRILVAQQDARAPIFYDSNDTFYYVNPNGNSILYKFENINQRCAYDRAWDNYPSITVFNNTDQGPVGDFRIHGVGGPSGGDFNVRLLVDGTVQSLSDVQAPIFYDSNNTAFYINPNSTSNVSAMVSYSLQGNGNVGGTGSASWHPSGIYSAGYNWLYGGISAGGGDISSVNNYYGNAYYDSGDTSTYVNPNGVSWIKGDINISRVATGGDNNCFGGLELREVSLVANTQTAATYSPRVNFHWGSIAAATIFMNSGGNFVFGGQSDITNNRRSIFCNELYATGNVTAYYSDDRLKTRKGNIENALDIVSSLNGFRYVDNDLAKTFGYANNGTQLGVSAQEVQKHLPEIVRPAAFDVDHDKPDQGSKTGENYLTVDYSRMIPLLIEAIKELRHEVEMLKK